MSSIDYLVKPVRLNRLEKTIEKLKLFDTNLSSKNILNVIKEVSQLQETKLMTSITVKKGDRLIFIKLDAVSHFQASEKYVTVFTKNETHLAEQSLIQLEQKLPTNFLRVHRGIIININFVKEVQKYFNSRFIITLNNIEKTKITTSRSYNEQIKNWMDV